MGKKYIIELGRCERLYKALIDDNGKPELAWLSTEIDLTPYTEPDLEQIRKEAYDKGYEDAEEKYNDGYSDGYDAGLDDAWKAARKIVLDTIPPDALIKMFGNDPYSLIGKIFEVYSASEVIARIKAWEEEQKEQKEFKVGDEFENGAGQKFVVIKMDGKEIDRYIDGDGRTYVMKEKYRVMRKTGRHFPEIAAVLEKMRGEQE